MSIIYSADSDVDYLASNYSFSVYCFFLIFHISSNNPSPFAIIVFSFSTIDN